MRFWDSSAIVPLVLVEESSIQLSKLASTDPEIAVWWGTAVECVSAVARFERHGKKTEASVASALRRLQDLSESWQEVDPSDVIRDTATRLLRVHPLRAADALQLAAAYIASDRRPLSLEFVTLDEKLATAARKEGFVVLPG